MSCVSPYNKDASFAMPHAARNAVRASNYKHTQRDNARYCSTSRRSQRNKGYGAVGAPPSFVPILERSAAYRAGTRGDPRATVTIWPRGSPICSIAWFEVSRRRVHLEGVAPAVVASAG
ncbi:hypothetical protein CLCR_11026 [Cladophialophora carrionii]|uniref:Uncharacterized protein n=1 Tax=Cladophialophora carrionii TaxID=86049 RepID=A0A1C1CXJ8_9EURO|nr:hypothetical protein CLCR_11026 [Cladophialophora carrionii]